MRIFYFLLVLGIVLALFTSLAFAGDCSIPAFVSISPKPNLLIGFDNSGSMYDLAYHAGEEDYCYDTSYNASDIYYGYFENDVIYKSTYDANSQTSTAFEEVDSLPTASACDNTGTTDTFCVQKNDKFFYFIGNFLNWLCMSKLDLIKKSLTGGKYESSNSTLVGQSRGCAGRRFVKEIPGSGFVFGVLGSTPKGQGFDNLFVGGTTRIEVYDNTSGDFSMDACFQAMDEVQSYNPNLGQLSKNTADCVGASNKSNALAAFNHSMQTCWAIDSGLGQGDISRIKNQCQNVYADIADSSGSIQWAELDPSHSAYVCSDQYIGACYDESDGSWGDDACLEDRYHSYCNVLDVPEVVDPSTDLANTGTFGNIPSILIDSGLVGQLGDPFAVLYTRKVQDQAPSGLLHEFKNNMNLGLMAFQDYGSDFELTTTEDDYYFYENGDADGAAMLSSVQEDNPSIISQFNALEAYSWTPIAEMLYEGSRYFGGTDSAYTSSLSYTSPISDWCQKNSILFLSDGGSTFDKNLPGTSFSPGAKGQSPVSATPYSFNISNYLNTSDYQAELAFSGTNYAKGVAYWAHTKDINLDMDDIQNIDFYTVFALGGVNGTTLLSDIAKYGGYFEKDETEGPSRQDEWDLDQDGDPDNFFSISDPNELYSKLKNTFSTIQERAGSAGSVATVTQEIKGEDLVLRGAFKSYDLSDPSTMLWQGHFENYWPYDASGETELQNQDACESAGGIWNGNQCEGLIYSFNVHPDQFCSEHNDHCWDAESYLPDYTARDIYTAIDGVKVSLDPTDQTMVDNLSLLENDIDFNQNGTVDLQDAKDLLWWIRGDTSFDGSSARNRQNWILGDIVYSTPVVVGQPSLASVPNTVALDSCDGVTGNACFFDYRVNLADRMKVVYVGGNDGMLHAFNAGEKNGTGAWVHEGGEDPNDDGIVIGEEIWAYIPSNLLSELKELARPSYGSTGCQHKTMVDLSPQVWDVKIDHDNDTDREWRTVLIGGERGGGDLYFALDVTDPKNPIILWEYPILRNMVFYDSGNYSYPFLNLSTYSDVKNWSASWTVPYVGRLDSDGVTFKASVPVSATDSSVTSKGDLTISNWGDLELSEYFAFIPVGIRIFGTGDASLQESLKPSIMAIDIENGVDIFQYIWPRVKDHYASWTELPQSGNNTIPFAMTSPLVLDIWDQNGAIGSDGYVDHLLSGDLNGNVYSLKMRFGSQFNQPKGFQLDVRKTKNATATTNSTNEFRSDLQPVTSIPVAAFDPDYNLRVYLGTGKYDDVSAGNNDRSDTAKMSFYSFTVDSLATANWSPSIGDSDLEGTGFSFNVEYPCAQTGYLQGCTWIRDCTAEDAGTIPDCCYGNFPCTDQGCSSSCWDCVLDFTIPGERVLDSALVAGGLVFFTTFVPYNDPCSNSGMSFIYVQDYLCRPLQENPLERSGLTVDYLAGSQWQDAGSEQSATVYRGRLKTSQIPSRPVLDSTGENVLVQTGDAKIHKIPVKLPEEPNYLKGWKEE